jgi:hypothetical protein
MALHEIRFYQLEANIAGNWEPIPGHGYATPGPFHDLLNFLEMSKAQRLRRVAGPSDDWKPDWFFVKEKGKRKWVC